MTDKNSVISVRMSKNQGKKHCYGELWFNCETNDRNVSVTKMSLGKKLTHRQTY